VLHRPNAHTDREDFTILDVGCGGGRTIQKLAAATQGMVYGVDYANGSVAAPRAKNAQLTRQVDLYCLRITSELPVKRPESSARSVNNFLRALGVLLRFVPLPE
jgi:ubiquinone/menaquinone biosynthesis C-methylase UbiE